jgi:hypothetical protein
MDMTTEPIVKAKVEGGVVVEAFLVWDIPQQLEDWITAPTEVGPGWLYDGSTFTPPPEG